MLAPYGHEKANELSLHKTAHAIEDESGDTLVFCSLVKLFTVNRIKDDQNWKEISGSFGLIFLNFIFKQ